MRVSYKAPPSKNPTVICEVVRRVAELVRLVLEEQVSPPVRGVEVYMGSVGRSVQWDVVN